MGTSDTKLETGTVTINGIEYVRADSVSVNQPINPDSPVRIVVLQRGWVVIGRYTEVGDDRVVLTDTSVIEQWGTTKGIGELVNGPTKNTQLRHAGTVEAHRLGVDDCCKC